MGMLIGGFVGLVGMGIYEFHWMWEDVEYLFWFGPILPFKNLVGGVIGVVVGGLICVLPQSIRGIIETFYKR